MTKPSLLIAHTRNKVRLLIAKDWVYKVAMRMTYSYRVPLWPTVKNKTALYKNSSLSAYCQVSYTGTRTAMAFPEAQIDSLIPRSFIEWTAWVQSYRCTECSVGTHKETTVKVKTNPPKLVPTGANFLINKDPQDLFYCKIWTPTEKFGPPHTDEKT